MEMVDPPQKASIAEFAAKLKEKYPAYKDQEDSVLVNAIIKKYPQYADQVNFQKKNSIESMDSSAPAQEPAPVQPSSSSDTPKTENEPDGFWSSLYKSAKNHFVATQPGGEQIAAFGEKVYSTLKHQVIPSTNLAIQTLISQGLKTIEYGAENTVGKIPGMKELDGAIPIPKPSDLHKFLLKDAISYAGEQGKQAEKMSDGFVNSYKDIHDVNSAATWASGALAQTAAQIIPAIFTGGASAAGQEIGSIYLESVKQTAEKLGITPEEVIDKNLDEPAIAIAGGLGAGALELIGAKGVAGAFSKSPAGQVFKSKMRSFFTNPIVGEIATEGAQTVIEHGSTALSTGTPIKEEFAKPETEQDIKESMAQAAIGGSVGVSIGHAMRDKGLKESKEIKPGVVNYLNSITEGNATMEDANKAINLALPYMKGLSKMQLSSIIEKGITDGSVVRDANGRIEFNSFEAAKGAVDYIKTHLAALPKYHPLVKSMGESVLNAQDNAPVTAEDLPVVKVKGSVEPVLVATTQDSEGNTIATHNTGLKNADTGEEMRVEEITDTSGNKTFQSEDGAIQGGSVEAVARQMQNSSLPRVTPVQVKRANQLIQSEGAAKPTLLKIYTEVFGFPEEVAKDFAETGARQITKMVKDNEDMTPEQAFDKLQKEGPPKENTADENWKEILGEKNKPKGNETTSKPKVKVFVYGTLQDEATREKALGEKVPSSEATLPGHTKEDGDYSTIKSGEGNVKGQMLELTPEQAAKLDTWEKNYNRKEISPGVFAYVRKDDVNSNGKKAAPKVTVKQFEKPDMENPVHVVSINGKEHFIQRSEGMNPGDTAWYEVVKDKDGYWQDANADKNKKLSGFSSIGDTKKEAIDHLVNKHENALQIGSPKSVGSHPGGDQATRGTEQGEGVGQSGQEPAAPEVTEPVKPSDEPSQEKVEPSQESMDVLDLLSGEIFPTTVKEFIEALKEFDAYSGPLGQFKAMGKLNDLVREGLVKLDGNKITPTFEKKGGEYAPQPMATTLKSNSKKKNPNTIVGGNGIFIKFDLDGLINKFKDFRQKYLRKIGYLPQRVFDLWVGSQGKIKEYQADVRFLVTRLRESVKEEYKFGITEDEIVDLNRALKGEPVLGNPIPPKTLAHIKEMRNMIKFLSSEFISRGLVSGPLAAKFQNDMEVYINRSFRKHDDPAWKDEVSTPVYNVAQAFILQQYPNLNAEQRQGLIDYLLYSPDAPMNAINGGSLGKIDLSALLKRGKIAPEIRALMGEYNDPIINFAKTIQKQAEILVKAQLHNDIKADGMGKYFFDVPTTKDGVEYKVQISPGHSPIPSVLGPLFTTQEIADAINETGGHRSFLSKATQAVPILGWLIKSSAKVNFGFTVLNPQSHSRNFLANPLRALANGHIRLDKVTKMGIFFQSVLQSDNAAKQALLKRYIRHNLLNSGASLGALTDYLNEMRNGIDLYTGVNATPPATKTGNKVVDALYSVDRFGTVIGKKAIKLWNNTIDGAALMYQWGDNAWKIYGFENEVANLKLAYPSWTPEQVDTEAARITLDQYATYQNIPKIVQEVKNVPMLGAFISFKAEVVRTFHNTLQQAFKEIGSGNKVLVGVGFSRLLGTAAALATFKIAAEAALGFVGGNGQDEDDLKGFAAEYQENNQFIMMGRNGDELTFVDVGPFDPHSYLLQVVRAGFRGESFAEGIAKATKEMILPFLNEQALFQKYEDVFIRNQKSINGKHIYNKDSSEYDQWMDKLKYLSKGLSPGIVKEGVKMGGAIRGAVDDNGNPLKISNELLAIFPGARVQTINFTTSLKYKEIEWFKRTAEADADYWMVGMNVNATKAELAHAEERHTFSINKIREESDRLTAAAQRQGAKR